jgi:hypothetical protein
MCIMKVFSFLLLTALLLSGCSADKKLYSAGYHIEWNSKVRKPETAESRPYIIYICSEPRDKRAETLSLTEQAHPEAGPETDAGSDLVASAEPSTIHQKAPKITPILPRLNLLSVLPSLSPVELNTDLPAAHRKMSGNALLGFVSSLVLLFPLAIYFGLKALNQINYNSEKYKGWALALTGLILGVIEVVAAFIIGTGMLIAVL